MLPAVLSVFIFSWGLIGTIIFSIFIWPIIHRLSNYLHNINDNYFDKYYRSKD
jgi:cell division protein FtsW (lipid II flippase)